MAKPAITEAQLPLAVTIEAVHQSNGERYRTLLRDAMEQNHLSRNQLNEETGRDLSHLGRMLDAHGTSHPSPDVVACILAHDKAGVVAAGVCAMCGRESVPKRADPEAENKLLRSQLQSMREEIDRLLGGVR